MPFTNNRMPVIFPKRNNKGIPVPAYFDTHLACGAIEAVNGIIQLAKRMARGFKNFVYFRTACHRAGHLKLAVPPVA
jgi:transposase